MTDADRKTEAKLTEIQARYRSLPVSRENVRACLIETLEAFSGVTEIGKTNTGYWIDKFHRTVGLRPGYPWCLMFLQYAYKTVSDIFGIKDLLPNNTAGTQVFASWAEETEQTVPIISAAQAGDILVWRNGKTAQGHVGAVIRVDAHHGQVIWLVTIEGNTSSKDYRDGGAVSRKSYEYALAELGARKQGRWLRCIVSFDALFNEAVK